MQTGKKSGRAQAESGTVGLADSYLTALWLRVKIPAACLNGGRGGAQRSREGDGADSWRLAWQRWWGQAQKVKGESAAIRKDFEPLTQQPSFRSVRSFPVRMVKKGNLCDSQSSDQQPRKLWWRRDPLLLALDNHNKTASCCQVTAALKPAVVRRHKKKLLQCMFRRSADKGGGDEWRRCARSPKQRLPFYTRRCLEGRVWMSDNSSRQTGSQRNPCSSNLSCQTTIIFLPACTRVSFLSRRVIEFNWQMLQIPACQLSVSSACPAHRPEAEPEIHVIHWLLTAMSQKHVNLGQDSAWNKAALCVLSIQYAVATA